jgi:hypothetical protein
MLKKVVEVLGDRTQTGILRNTGVCEYNIQPVFLVLDLCKEAIQIVELRDVALDTGYTSTDFLYCRGQLRRAAAGDEHVRALVHKPLRRSKTNPAGTSGYESNFYLRACPYLFLHPGRVSLLRAPYASGPDAILMDTP